MIKESSYQHFVSSLNNTSIQNNFPVRAMFELTYRCNFRCKHCYIPEKLLSGRYSGELSTSEVFEVLEQLKKLGVFYLGFTGGEIFTRQDLREILNYATGLGFQIIISTNGSYIDEDWIFFLKSISINKVDISLHTLVPDTFNVFTQISNAFSKVKHAIDLLGETEIPYTLRANLTKFNAVEVMDLKKWAKNQNIFLRIDTEMHPKWGGDTSPYEMTLSAEELENLFGSSSIVKKSEGSGCGHKVDEDLQGRDRLFTCGVGTTGVAISPLGYLKPCLHLDTPQYSVLTEGVLSAWKKMSGYFKDLKMSSDYECHSCEFAAECKWCPAVSHVEVGDLFKCSERSKLRAQKRKQIISIK